MLCPVFPASESFSAVLFFSFFCAIPSLSSATSTNSAPRPPPEQLQDAIARLAVFYPREWEAYIDEAQIRAAAAGGYVHDLINHANAQRKRQQKNQKTREASAP